MAPTTAAEIRERMAEVAKSMEVVLVANDATPTSTYQRSIAVHAAKARVLALRVKAMFPVEE